MEYVLQYLDFSKGSKWVYDPYGVIARRKPTTRMRNALS